MTRYGLVLTLLLARTAAQSVPAASAVLAVVNQKQHALLLVDPQTHDTLATVPVGINGHEIAVSPDGTLAYVPIYGNAGVGRPGTDGQEIDVVDVLTKKMVGAIDLGRPLRPHKAIFGPDGLLYVSGELAHAILLVDVHARAVVGEIPTGAKESHMFCFSPDGSRIYTANVGDGSVSVLDVKARKVIQVIPLTKRVQRIAVSRDGRWVFTSDWDQPRLAVIDTRSNTLSRWLPTAGMPYVTFPTVDGTSLLVAETDQASGSKGVLEVFHLADWKPARSFPLPSAQNGGFLVRGDLVYLSEPLGGNIEVLNTKSWTLEQPIVLAVGVDGLGWVR